MELPLVRNPTQEEFSGGKVCQLCRHWLRNPHSYGYGVCILAGIGAQPRWSLEGQLCDGFRKG